MVTLRIEGHDIKRVLVDQGSGIEIMYLDLYKGLNLKPEDLTTYDSPLVSFDEEIVTPRGQIRPPVQAGSEVVKVDFIVVNAYSSYTAIVARPWLYALEVVSLTLHLKVKYPSGDQIEELVGSDDSEKFFQIGTQLPPQEKEELVEFLQRNVDVFTWNAYEAPGVDPSFICHYLNVNPSVTPKKQPHRRSFKNHSDAVKDEVMKLKQARAIKEEKTAFVTLIGNYHYKVMPFGLKNVGSTNRRMITRIFEPQLGRNIEIYIDNMVVKSKLESEHINDLENIFEILRRHKL
nr:uncharacterized protein LOC112002713 [Quercus suber]